MDGLEVIGTISSITAWFNPDINQANIILHAESELESPSPMYDEAEGSECLLPQIL
jgi:hypothetical protein